MRGLELLREPCFYHLQPDTIALLGNNYSLQMIETGFAEQFYASHRMGPALICLKISARIVLKGDLSNDTVDNLPLFSFTFKLKGKKLLFSFILSLYV